MSTNKTWPGGTVDATPTSYSIPDAADLNWQNLSSFLQALGDSAQGTTFQKWAVRKATSSPVTVSATTDCVVVTDLTVAGAVTVNLPAGATKQVFVIIDGKGDAATNNITINRNGTDTIKGATSLVLTHNRDAVVLVYNGTDTDWKVLGPVTIPGSLTAADISGQIPATQIGGGAVDNTEFSYLDGVTSALQTQLNGKQPLDSDLTAIAALATTGLIARTGSGTVATRTITAGSNKLAVTDGDGVAANPTVDVTEANLTLNNIGGTLGVTKGGTGITSGTSGGVPYYSAGTTIASSGALTASGVVLGGGAGASPTSTAAGSANQVLRVPGGGGAPAFGAVDLAQSAAVTGTLPVGNGGTGITSLGSGVATFLGIPSSANLAAALTDETGSGAAVFGTSPTLTTPTLTTPTVDAALNLQQISTPANPSSGYSKVYPKSDGLLYKLDSAGNEVLVGSGSGAGEINIVINPDADTALDGSRTNGVGDWVDSGTGTTSTRTTTAAEIPLSPTKTNGIKIANDGSSTGYTRLRMTLPVALQNRKLKIAWQQLYSTSTAYASGDFKLELYSNAASNYSGAYTAIALSTDASGVTSIPALNGQFQTTFDSSTAANLELRITRVTGTTNSYIALNAVTVGPGIQPQGAVVGEWLSLPVTMTNMGTGASASLNYRRVGSSMEIQGRFTTGTSVPASIGKINITGFTITPATVRTVGMTGISKSTTNNVLNMAAVLVDPSSDSSALYFAQMADGTSTNNLTAQNASVLFTSSTTHSLNVVVPISEWSGSGTVNLATSDSMGSPLVYNFTAWNPSGTGATTTDPSAGSVSVSNADISVSGPTTGTVTFTFNRQGKYLVSPNTGHKHTNTYTSARFLITHGGTATRYGNLQDSQTGNTGIDAQDSDAYINNGTFILDVTAVGQTYTFRPRYDSDGISIAAQHTAYASVVIQPLWGVGQAVGFGIVVPGTSAGLVSASGVPGNTTGNAIASGYVGEKLAATLSNSGTLTTATPTNVGTISLTAGVWLVYAKGYLEVTSATSTYTNAQISISTTSATIDNTTRDLKNSPVNSTDLTFTPGNLYVNTSATQTVYLVGQVGYTGGAIRFNGSNSEFVAIRIA